MKLIRSILCVTALFISMAASVAYAMAIPDEQAAAAAAKQQSMQTNVSAQTQCPCADTDTKAMCDKKQPCNRAQCGAKGCPKDCQNKKCSSQNSAVKNTVNTDMDAQESVNTSINVVKQSPTTTQHK